MDIHQKNIDLLQKIRPHLNRDGCVAVDELIERARIRQHVAHDLSV